MIEVGTNLMGPGKPGDILDDLLAWVGYASDVPPAELITRAGDEISRLRGIATMNAIDATAAMNLWNLRKFGTDPLPAVRGMTEFLQRIAKRSDDAKASAK